MEHYQSTRIPLTNARLEESPVGELIVANSRQGQFSVVVDPSVKEIAIQIRLNTAGFIGNILLWNVSRDIVDHQTVFKTNPVPFTIGQNPWEIKYLKPPSKVPFKLFLTFNIMNPMYSGVLFCHNIITNDDLKSNVMHIYETIKSTATTSPLALQFNRNLADLTTALGIQFYPDEIQLVDTLLFGADGYVDLVKEKKFLNVFKSYAQLRNALALMAKPYFKIDEMYIMQRLPTEQRGTFAVTFSNLNPGLLVVYYKSGGMFPESKFLGYFAAPEAIPLQPYYYKAKEDIRCEMIEPPGQGYYQIEMAANIQHIPLHVHIDSWIGASIELQNPLYD